MRRLACAMMASFVVGCSAAPANNAAPDFGSGSGSGSGADAPNPLPVVGAGEPSVSIDCAGSHAVADRALHDFLLKFWNAGAQYLNADYPSTGKDAAYWVYAQAIDAVADGADREPERYRGMLDTLLQAQPSHGWLTGYNDDENWMALALMRAFDHTGNRDYLNQAESLYRDHVLAAWDDTCCGTHKGGIWWNDAHTQKATAANGGAVITGVRLAARTGKPAYLDFAKKVYDFWSAYYTDPVTHQTADHITPDGTISWWKFTYNEGVMIGGAVELYRALGDARFLADAHHYAAFMLAHEVRASSLGDVLSDGAGGTCGGDCAQFKGIGFRYLGELYARDRSRADYANLLATSANAIWKLARDPSSGLFATDWAGPTVTSAIIDQESSAAMALGVQARLCGAAPAATAGSYEAEDAQLHSVGLEASHAGFSGWGYVAGWNADGQWIDFHVEVGPGGAHTLDFDYAAGAGDAARQLYIDGATVVATLPFPSTGSWDRYGHSSANVSLTAGAHVISVIYSGTNHSAAYLNLDRLVVR